MEIRRYSRGRTYREADRRNCKFYIFLNLVDIRWRGAFIVQGGKLNFHFWNNFTFSVIRFPNPEKTFVISVSIKMCSPSGTFSRVGAGEIPNWVQSFKITWKENIDLKSLNFKTLVYHTSLNMLTPYNKRIHSNCFLKLHDK